MSKLLGWAPSAELITVQIHEAARCLQRLAVQSQDRKRGNPEIVAYLDKEQIVIRWLSAPTKTYLSLGTLGELYENAPKVDPFWHFVKLIEAKL